jgi:hypothetical protein
VIKEVLKLVAFSTLQLTVECMSSGGFGRQSESTDAKTQAGKVAQPKESADIAYTLCCALAFIF